MADDNGARKFGLGIIIGAIIGALAGLFLAPKSGKELQEDVAKGMSDLKRKYKSGELQKEIKSEIDKRVREFKGKVSRSQYAQIVDEVMDKMRKSREITSEEMGMLRDRLMEEWKGE